MKNLKRVFWCAVFVLAIVAGADALLSNKPQERVTQQSVTTNMPNSSDEFLDLIPDGSSMSYDDFKKKAGTDIGKLLSWASPKTITRKGSHIIIESTGAASTTTGSTTISVADKVEFDVETTTTGLAVKNIKGVTVDAGAGAMPLRKATLSVDANGNTTVKASLELFWWAPYITHTTTLGPDGKPIK